MKRMITGAAVAATTLALTATTALSEGELVISANTSDAAPRAAFEAVVDKFRTANPDIDVQFNVIEHEAYKTAIRNFLVADEGPDVGFWFAGNRMAGFVEKGLFADISDVWAENGLAETMASTMPSITFDGKQYGLPYSYYQWGIYYREDVFADNGVGVPATYDDLLAACETLNAAGIAPVTIGTKFLWTAAGWFDYLNMRTNGLEFHIDLMLGKAKYNDDRVVATMANWRKALDAGCFIENHQNYSWQEAQPPLINGEAAMYLIGNFLVPNLPEDTVANMNFFQFPDITPGMARGEDAPTDLVFVPANAQNKDNAKKFLAFLSQPENAEAINQALQTLPPNSEAKPLNDKFLNAGAAMLAQSQTAQFYDRDTTPEMAKVGMQGFQDFMLNPDDVLEILDELEEERARIFGDL
ncbi:N-Acetyl-D-glucosamine ABC transport system, sugar-binding protein [Candidatus Rhodobacter oscarellae]|uniref:N-Acetyl-D-glucosamine ABC transport system, sugar-binding protein n=1 Tax=Candidatus Rhodobacter oscarellae TaxID=1675527 RepID=A0A0J9E5T8_9RHOB|nr:extracellular solute-binding protein [Candidatus Rhodobacter lobularis]KMW58031.1 N-Acetyl-D-glucosamine ABC transport system, sugar-binding protein [Candidatus Rhodobacter lobularis]